MEINELILPDHEFDEQGVCKQCGCLKNPPENSDSISEERKLLHPLSRCPITVKANEVVLFHLVCKLEEELNSAKGKNFQLRTESREKERVIGLLRAELETYKSDPKNQGRMIAALVKDRDQTIYILEERNRKMALALMGEYPAI